MKRSWVGFWLLLVLLVIALLVTWAMQWIHEPIAGELEAAAEHALAGRWENAQALSRYAREDWEKYEAFRSCFADHGPMEEIDACFAQLEVYGNMREEVAFAASCGEIARKVEAMGEAHGLVWRNVL